MSNTVSKLYAPLRRCALLAFIVLPLILTSTGARAANSPVGVIQGRVTNGTTNESMPGLNVKLQRFQARQPIGSATATTASGGEFQFVDLDTAPEFSYIVTSSYKQVDFDSGEIGFDKDQTSLTVELPVYEPGAGIGAVSSQRGHTVIVSDGAGLSVLEFESLVNSDNKVFIPPAAGNQGTLQLFLPKEAESLSLIAGVTSANATKTDKGLIFTGPVKPGQNDIAYGYRIPLAPGQGQYLYVRPITYPVSGYSLLVRGDNLQVQSSSLQEQAPVTINKQTYKILTADKLAAGTNIMISISLSAVPVSAASSSSPFSPWLFGAVPAVLVLAVLGFFLWKRRKAPAVAVAPTVMSPTETLMDELARLDDSFEAGEIPEEVYRQTRAKKKAELLRLMQRGQ